MVWYINMKSLKCDYPGCDKVIEGYNKKHVEFLMMQHKLKHRREKAKEEKVNE